MDRVKIAQELVGLARTVVDGCENSRTAKVKPSYEDVLDSARSSLERHQDVKKVRLNPASSRKGAGLSIYLKDGRSYSIDLIERQSQKDVFTFNLFDVGVGSSKDVKVKVSSASSMAKKLVALFLDKFNL
jgi:hypothetical protein